MDNNIKSDLDFRARLEQLMHCKVTPDMLGEYHAHGMNMDNADVLDAMSASMIIQALNGNIGAYTTIRDTTGNKPVDKVENNTTIQIVLSDDVKRLGE